MPIFAEAAKDVFHVHDGIVHDHADGNGETTQGHRVDRDTGELEIEPGDDERERNGGEGDRRGAEVQQEQEQHDDDHDGAVPDGLLDVGDGGFDEVRLLEQLIDLHVRRQRPADLLEGGLNLAGKAHRIHAGLLLHREDDGRLAVHARIAAHHLFAKLHIGDIAQAHRNALADDNHSAGDVVQ